ncbi:MAG TPA: MGMT family protein [Capsulimonadaceae bacterium]|nr:MGMT family protein [Capsulimonadaceae bacterium]
MDQAKDMIFDISPEREKFFGGPGKMLLPCAATVEKLLGEIPEKTLITTELLQKTLAERAGADVTCPVATRHALQAIAKAGSDVGYWRVVKKNGDLVAYYPGGRERQAKILADEGFAIDSHGKIPRVAGLKDHLTRF